jgi:hypothetical protein
LSTSPKSEGLISRVIGPWLRPRVRWTIRRAPRRTQQVSQQRPVTRLISFSTENAIAIAKSLGHRWGAAACLCSRINLTEFVQYIRIGMRGARGSAPSTSFFCVTVRQHTFAWGSPVYKGDVAQIAHLNQPGDTTMFTKTNIALSVALILGAASAAGAQTNPSAGTITCPTLEGYPDCHPDGGASSTIYSTSSRRPAADLSRHQRKP